MIYGYNNGCAEYNAVMARGARVKNAGGWCERVWMAGDG